MTALERIREYAQGLLDEEARKVEEVGLAGAHDEIVRADVARNIMTVIQDDRTWR